MQTVKTAAIVVLLMTVLYGGYVSLTTPPEPIPQEVAELINIEDDLNIETGFADSLALNEVVPGSEASSALNEISTQAGPNTYGTSFADLVPNAVPSGSSAELTPMPAAQSLQSSAHAAAPNKLPSVGDANTSIQVAAGQSYPSTGNTIDLPDPSSVSFDSSTGSAFQPDSMTSIKSLTPPEPNAGIAKSGDVPQASAYTAPDGQITQAAAIEPKPNLGLTNALKTADRQYGKDQLKEALATLSVFYSVPNVSPSQREDLLGRLDPLAREVIYSKRHLLEQPYRVARGEKLVDIAAKFDVPWQLLANINGLKNPVTILPGTELKVVRGPFSAQVDLDKKELTLFLNDLYAGRFPIDVGSDPAPKTGTFVVQDKQTDRAFLRRQRYSDSGGQPR